MAATYAPPPPPPAARGYSSSGVAGPAGFVPAPPSIGQPGFGSGGYAPAPPAAAVLGSAPAVSEAQAKPAAPARHAFGDRSHIAPAHKPMVAALDSLLATCKETKTNPQQKREFDDTERKAMIFVDQLNNGEVPDDVATKMATLFKALESKDFPTAARIHEELIKTRLSATSAWIVGIKRIITTLQTKMAQQQYPQQFQQQQNAPPPPPTFGPAGGAGAPPPPPTTAQQAAMYRGPPPPQPAPPMMPMAGNPYGGAATAPPPARGGSMNAPLPPPPTSAGGYYSGPAGAAAMPPPPPPSVYQQQQQQQAMPPPPPPMGGPP
ncbi:protein transport protein S31, partial [Cladochytrium tenue]